MMIMSNFLMLRDDTSRSVATRPLFLMLDDAQRHELFIISPGHDR